MNRGIKAMLADLETENDGMRMVIRHAWAEVKFARNRETIEELQYELDMLHQSLVHAENCLSRYQALLTKWRKRTSS